MQGGRDSSQSDSGGLLIVGVDGYQVEMGMVSQGFGCALPGDYGYYIAVASSSDWIPGLAPAFFLQKEESAGDLPTLTGSSMAWNYRSGDRTEPLRQPDQRVVGAPSILVIILII